MPPPLCRTACPNDVPNPLPLFVVFVVFVVNKALDLARPVERAFHHEEHEDTKVLWGGAAVDHATAALPNRLPKRRTKPLPLFPVSPVFPVNQALARPGQRAAHREDREDREDREGF